MIDLRDPLTLAPLTRQPLGGGAAVWTGGSQDWPEIDRIPYLRVGRDELAARVVALLRAGRVVEARAELLRDQDDFARQPPPSLETTLAISREEPSTFREAMRRLEYGPVAHYFAHRTSTPTFLSGLWMIDSCYSAPGMETTFVEIACGVGHFIRNAEQFHREARSQGVTPVNPPAIGVDVVWSKLWLGRRYLELSSPLICADVCGGSLPLADGTDELPVPSVIPTPPQPFTPSSATAPRTRTAFCHDAFYFFPDKVLAYAEMRRIAKSVIIGHAHLRSADHGDVAGTPLSVAEYAELTDQGLFEDDAACTRAAVRGISEHKRYRKGDVAALSDAEAVCWRDPGGDLPDDFLEPGAMIAGDGVAWNGRLRLNPLLTEQGGRLVPDWPEARFAAEYAGADYLTGPIPTQTQIEQVESGNWTIENDEIRDFIRRRTFIDVPERW